MLALHRQLYACTIWPSIHVIMPGIRSISDLCSFEDCLVCYLVFVSLEGLRAREIRPSLRTRKAKEA